MSHFYGTVTGQAGEATRRGSKTSGLVTEAATWNGAIRVYLEHSPISGKDRYTVELGPWKGNGKPTQLLAEGIIE